MAQAGLKGLITPELEYFNGLPGGSKGKESTCNVGHSVHSLRRVDAHSRILAVSENPVDRGIPADYSPHGCKDLDMIERLSLSGVPLTGCSPRGMELGTMVYSSVFLLLALRRTKKRKVWNWKAVPSYTILRTEETSAALRA